MVKRVVFSSFILFTSALYAQPYLDVISFRSYLMPYDTGVAEGDKKLILWYTIGADIPVKLKKDILVFSPTYETYSIDVNTNLYGLAIPVSYIKQWSDSPWKTAFSFIPRYNYSQFSSSNSMQFGGAVLAIYKKKENLKYKFGAYYNSEFFGFFMIPLLGIDWNVNDKLNVFGVLPGSMNVEYKAWQRIYTGISFRSITNSFRGFADDDYYKIQDNHLRLFFDFYLTKNLVLTAEAGHSIFRKYTYGVRNDDVKFENDLKFSNGIICKVAMSWRIRLDGKGTQ